MRALERRVIESGEIAGLTLMERAGEGVVAAILAQWPAPARAASPATAPPRRAVVLCGPGNNGGDGFVIARLLVARGWAVHLCATGAEALQAGQVPTGDAGENARRWVALGQPVHPLTANSIAAGLSEGAVLVDALLGLGQTRSPADLLAPVHQACAGVSGLRRVAVDMPTGLCSETGRHLCPDPFRADLTVTFHAMKPCHVLADGPAICGAVQVVPIGLQTGAEIPLIRAPLVALDKTNGHKFAHGHALVLAGGTGKGGAARLAARAALRVGAGLVTLACPLAALAENAARLDAIMLSVFDQAEDIDAMLRDTRISALALGPGLGLEARALTGVETILRDGRACVLDADALTLIARHDHLRAALHDGCVLTPHDGEFARLCPDLSARLRATPGPSRIEAAVQAAQTLGATVLLKGPDTVIAAPDGRCAVHAAVRETAVPWLATAGAGDVLTGLIAGLLARGVAPFDAAGTAAWLHARAAQAIGPGLIAEDLPEALPSVLRACCAPD